MCPQFPPVLNDDSCFRLLERSRACSGTCGSRIRQLEIERNSIYKGLTGSKNVFGNKRSGAAKSKAFVYSRDPGIRVKHIFVYGFISPRKRVLLHLIFGQSEVHAVVFVVFPPGGQRGAKEKEINESWPHSQVRFPVWNKNKCWFYLETFFACSCYLVI